MNNDIKLVLFDMDGTLLNSNKEIPKDFEMIFNKLKAKGITLGIASGRPLKNLQNYFPNIYKEMVYVCENGGCVSYQNKIIYTNSIDKELCDKAIIKSREVKDAEILLCGLNATYYESDREDLMPPARMYYPNLIKVDDLLKVEDAILKMTMYDFIGSSVNTGIAFKDFDEGLDTPTSAKNWLDIMPKGTSKKFGTKVLLDKMGISFNECMVFGDYYNDYDLLKVAKYSYAMGNAEEGIKEICNYQCGSNDSNAIVETLIEVFKV